MLASDTAASVVLVYLSIYRNDNRYESTDQLIEVCQAALASIVFLGNEILLFY